MENKSRVFNLLTILSFKILDISFCRNLYQSIDKTLAEHKNRYFRKSCNISEFIFAISQSPMVAYYSLMVHSSRT